MTIFLKSGGESRFADVELWPFAPLEVRLGGAMRFRRLWRWIARTGRLFRTAFTAARRRRAGFRQLTRLNDHALRDVGLNRSELPGWTSGRIQGWRTLEPWR
jgi:uncharacterized protein YjiS (DUF1127 family)